MRYYAQYDDDNKLILIGVGLGDLEITEEQYLSLLSEIKAKSELVDKLYSDEITLEEVPIEWRSEVQSRVDERKRQQKI